MSDLECKECGPDKTATVIVVREEGFRDQRYEADSWDCEDAIDVKRGDEIIASYPAGRWLRVHRADALVAADDSTPKALAIAKEALNAITRISDPNVAIRLASDALDEIFAETEL